MNRAFWFLFNLPFFGVFQNRLKNENHTVEHLIESHGYPVETHHLRTSDGYILTLHRIPNGKVNKSLGKVAFLQHGILQSSADWVLTGPDKGLGFILADKGYDVWLGNARGNTQSKGHKKLSTKKAKFWQFSWHEIGMIDLPEMIDYVLDKTKANGVYYVGFSQGTTAFYVMTSSLPKYNRKIKVHVSLAPIAFMNHMTSPLLRMMSHWTDSLEKMIEYFGINEFLPNNAFIKHIVGDFICKEDSITQALCTNALFAICGFSRRQINATLLPVMTKYTPAGASTKQVVHYLQEIRSGKFRQYDHGTVKNLNLYGNTTPPEYPLKNIKAPVYLIYSKNDWLAAGKDVDRLCSGIRKSCKDKILVSDSKFNHLDFLFGIDAPILIYDKEYLIESYGYKVETHQVITTDGYNLTLHRIPSGRTKRNLGKVAFVQHGILESSADWVLTGPKNGLGFILADEGYDVWMANARGNTQSRAHTTLTPKDKKFWQFSWHEIGTIDVPQMIDYVLKTTGKDGVYYVGHSQGTTVYYVMTSSLPEYNKKVKVQVSLAPIGFMNHMTSPLLQLLSFWTGTIETLTNIIGINEFLPNSDFIKYIVGDKMCKEDAFSQLLCTNALFAICGFSRRQMNSTLLPLLTKYTPAGSSTKQIIHYGQETRSGKFRQYDYGLISNLKVYGKISPPDYKLSNIKAPTYLIYSKNDWLSAEKDVDRLCKGMKDGCQGKILISDFKFNHLDFVFGIDAPTLVYNKVISLFARH